MAGSNRFKDFKITLAGQIRRDAWQTMAALVSPAPDPAVRERWTSALDVLDYYEKVHAIGPTDLDFLIRTLERPEVGCNSLVTNYVYPYLGIAPKRVEPPTVAPARAPAPTPAYTPPAPSNYGTFMQVVGARIPMSAVRRIVRCLPEPHQGIAVVKAEQWDSGADLLAYLNANCFIRETNVAYLRTLLELVNMRNLIESHVDPYEAGISSGVSAPTL